MAHNIWKSDINHFPPSSGKVFLNTIEYMDSVHEEWTTMLPNLSSEDNGDGGAPTESADEEEEEAPVAVEVNQEEEEEEKQNGVAEEAPTLDSPIAAESPCGN